MMFANGRVKDGDKVLILGASGGVGSCCVLLAETGGMRGDRLASSASKLEGLRISARTICSISAEEHPTGSSTASANRTGGNSTAAWTSS